MLEILLNLFNEKEVQKLIIESYNYSQKTNKVLSDKIFAQLIYLKQINPEINITLDHKQEVSHYSAKENIIYLNEKSTVTFFHELTHLFSFNCINFNIQNRYNELKQKMNESKKKSILVNFLNLCNEKKKNIKVRIEKANLLNGSNITQELIELSIIESIEDVIDAIYGGEAYDSGLYYEKNNNYISNESERTAGHGRNYYKDEYLQIEEIVAIYQTIKLIDPNNELFLLLTKILEEEFLLLLEYRCNEINNNLNINDNTINKKR